MSKIDNIIEAIEVLRTEISTGHGYEHKAPEELCVMGEMLLYMRRYADRFKWLEE